MLHSGKACRTSHFYRHFLKESTVCYFKCSYAVYGGSIQQFIHSDMGKLCIIQCDIIKFTFWLSHRGNVLIKLNDLN